MADNDNPNKYHPSKRGYRPHRQPMPPGVRKAVTYFGVRDLRELLDRKHQDDEDGTTAQHKENEPRSKGINPPPDPSYNFLKDSSRDQGKPSGARRNDTYRPPRQYENFRRGKESPVNQSSAGDSDHNGPKKELRFSDSPRIGRGSFRGARNTNRKREEKIENPVNIKVELTFETGQRNCTLDENTKIPDIKHVSDNYRPRGGYRGRGSFRGRGRGRGNFVSRRNYRNDYQKTDKVGEDSSETKEEPENDKEPNKGDADQEYHEEHDEEADETYEGEEEEATEEHGETGNELEPPEGNVDTANLDKETGGGFDSNLKESITITSSKYQDGETKREVKVESLEE